MCGLNVFVVIFIVILLTIACSILLSMATTLAPEALQKQEGKVINQTVPRTNAANLIPATS